MGMDVYGRKPKSEVGEYFRRNVWGWRPLWEYCCNIHIDIIGEKLAEYGHYNAGYGLSVHKSVKLAKALKEDVRSGTAEQYIQARDEHIKSLPEEPCKYCDENGNRTWLENELEVVKVCNACQGKKSQPHFATWYRLDLDDIKEFAEFLENCGGFNIY